MKPTLPTEINEIPTPKDKRQLTPQLLFLSASWDNGEREPKDIEKITSGCFDRKNLHSNTFWNKFKTSPEIIIIDKFFEKEDLEKILKIIEKLKEKQKLITFEKLVLFTENIKSKKEILSAIKRNLAGKFRVYELKNKNIHDRFAILDGELFHFGSTVGGKTTEGFTAFSCGWEADKLDILINQLKGNNKYAEVYEI